VSQQPIDPAALRTAREKLSAINAELKTARDAGARLAAELEREKETVASLKKVENGLTTELQSLRERRDDLPAQTSALRESVRNKNEKLAASDAELLKKERTLNLSGSDPAKIVAPTRDPSGFADNSSEGALQRWQQLRDDEKEGRAAPGTSLSFFQKHKDALLSQRSTTAGNK
jgi:hypothetical protein